MLKKPPAKTPTFIVPATGARCYETQSLLDVAASAAGADGGGLRQNRY